MSNTTLRAFVGIPLPTAARQSLARMQRHVRDAGVRAAWVAPDNFHITLRFLGTISRDQIATLDAVLRRKLDGATSCQLGLEKLGVFPSLKRPTVGWAGLRERRGALSPLYAAACEAAGAIGIAPEERPFSPHVTLFRLRNRQAPQRLPEVLSGARSLAMDDFWVDTVALWRSELRRGGAVYQKLKEYPLQCLPNRSSHP